MQNPPRKRLTLPLHEMYVVCQYIGAAAVCLGYPGTVDPVRLWPGGPQVARPMLMLWALALLFADVLLDRSWLRALKADLAEGDRGLHRRTLEALAAPVLFIMDVVAILAVLSSQRETDGFTAEIRLHTAAMAAGIILWIYGRLMPRIPYNSIWGIRSKAALKGVAQWGAVHLSAMPGVCLCGGLSLVAGTFLSPAPALACAAACLVAAFGIMFTRKA